MQRTKARYRFSYSGVIVKLGEREYVFNQGTGDFDWSVSQRDL
jgi:hypothetical protein